MLDDFRHARALLRVAETRNFTRAANSLHLSQSALTVQIQQIEETLGFRVFDRSKRGVTLTTAGAEILEPLRRLLDDADALLRNARDLAEVRNGSVTIAALPTVSAGFLPGVIASFRSLRPGIRVLLLDVMADRVREAVLKRQADFGIGTAPGKHAELSAKPLYSDQLVLFVPRGHTLSQSETVSLQEAATHQLILPTRDSSVREQVEAIAHRQKLTIRPQYETNFMPTALALVRNGAGVAILPESAAAMEVVPDLVSVRLPNEFSRQLVLLERTDRLPSPAATAFLDELRQHLRRKAETERSRTSSTKKKAR